MGSTLILMRRLLLAALMICLLLPAYSFAAAGLQLSLELPYSLAGQQMTVAPGQQIHAMFNIENSAPESQRVTVRLELHLDFRWKANRSTGPSCKALARPTSCYNGS